MMDLPLKVVIVQFASLNNQNVSKTYWPKINKKFLWKS